MRAKPKHNTHLWLLVESKWIKGFFSGGSYFSLSGHEVSPDDLKLQDWRNDHALAK